MGYLISKGYELLTMLLPFLIVFAVLNKKYQQNKQPISSCHFLLLCVFALYIIATIYFTGAGTIFGILRYHMELHSGDMVNFIPFVDIDTAIATYLLNILLFIPLGFLLPFIWPHTNRFKYILSASLAFSLLIEISQLWGHRITDIDDLMMNITGALLGYLAYRLFARITSWRHKRLDYVKYEPLIYVGAMFFGHFLLYYGVGMAKLLGSL